MTGELKFHPLADMFPLMEDEEFDALVADIKANDLHEPIVVHQGKILDGRNRYRACLAAGIKPPLAKFVPELEGDPRAYVISRNIVRRHLTAEQKRDLIAKLIKATPERSDRQIAKTAKVDHKTVSAARTELEATGEIPQLEKTVGADGKARKKRRLGQDQGFRREINFRAFVNKANQSVDDAAMQIEPANKIEWQAAINAARAAAAAWTNAAEQLARRGEWSEALIAAGAFPHPVTGAPMSEPCCVPIIEAKAEEIIKAKFAADDGLDIPECLRRN